MLDLTVQCACGRQMATDGLRGRGAYRCGCGLQIHVDVQPARSRICVFTVSDVRCRLAAVVTEPVALCGCHDQALRSHFVGQLMDKPITAAEANVLIAAWLDRTAVDHLNGEIYLQDRAAVEAAKEARAAASRRRGEVVYYIKFGDRIKIGTTRNLRQRRINLPCDSVLAAEPGGRPLERERHAQFASSRVIGEWFEPSPDLLAHIEGVARRYPR